MRSLQASYLNTPLNISSIETNSNDVITCLNNTYYELFVIKHQYLLYSATKAFRTITQIMK